MTEEAAESSEPTDAEEPVAPPPGVGIQSYPGGWHLVEKGTWQVSVSPDGMIMLPRHLHPLEIADFCAAAAGAVGSLQCAGRVSQQTHKICARRANT